MSNVCPRCGSHHITPNDPGRRLGSRLGALAGAAAAVVTVTRGAQVGVTVGAFAGPGGMVAGGLTGVLLAALFAGSAGGALGGALGKLADESFLNDRRCVDCGFTFRGDGEYFGSSANGRHPHGGGDPVHDRQMGLYQ